MKKYQFPPDLPYRIRLQTPSGKHRKFRLIKIYKNQSKTEEIKHEALDSLNKSFIKGRFTAEVARKEAELLVERLYKEAGVKAFKMVSNSDNQRLLQEFWKEVYGRKRLRDKDSAFAKYRRAVEAIGEVSLQTGSVEEMQAELDRHLNLNLARNFRDSA